MAPTVPVNVRVNCEDVTAVAANAEGAAGIVIDVAPELTVPFTPVTPIVYACVTVRPENVAVFEATLKDVGVAPVNVYVTAPVAPAQLKVKPVAVKGLCTTSDVMADTRSCITKYGDNVRIVKYPLSYMYTTPFESTASEYLLIWAIIKVYPVPAIALTIPAELILNIRAIPPPYLFPG